MGIYIQDVEYIAKLARLDLSSEGKECYKKQLNTILKYAEKLNQLNTNDIPPTTHVVPLWNVMRKDEVRPSLAIEKIMANAPEEQQGQFKVPAILDRSDVLDGSG